jgi:uncharacterized membrane protein YdbT with pleckstrin-like domain
MKSKFKLIITVITLIVQLVNLIFLSTIYQNLSLIISVISYNITIFIIVISDVNDVIDFTICISFVVAFCIAIIFNISVSITISIAVTLCIVTYIIFIINSMIKNMKCKFRKQCKEYQNDSALCNEDRGTWNYDHGKANCYIDMEKRDGNT